VTLNLNESISPGVDGDILTSRRGIVMGLFMSLVILYGTGDVQDSQGVSVSEMAYIVSGWASNTTHSLVGAFHSVWRVAILDVTCLSRNAYMCDCALMMF